MNKKEFVETVNDYISRKQSLLRELDNITESSSITVYYLYGSLYIEKDNLLYIIDPRGFNLEELNGVLELTNPNYSYKDVHNNEVSKVGLYNKNLHVVKIEPDVLYACIFTTKNGCLLNILGTGTDVKTLLDKFGRRYDDE